MLYAYATVRSVPFVCHAVQLAPSSVEYISVSFDASASPLSGSYHRPDPNVSVALVAPTVLNDTLSSPGSPGPASTWLHSGLPAHAGYVPRPVIHVCCAFVTSSPPPTYVQSSPSPRSMFVALGCTPTASHVPAEHPVSCTSYSAAPSAPLHATVMWFWRTFSAHTSAGGSCGAAVEPLASRQLLISTAPPPVGVSTVRTRT